MRLAMACAMLLSAAASGFAQMPANSYVGSEPCRTCHPNQWATFYKNPHFKSVASGKETPERTGCESCHGPGQRHLEQRGGKSSIVAFSEATPQRVLDTCLRCHNQTLSRANIRRSSHTLNGVICTKCHSIHSSPAPQRLLAKTQATLCYDCHPDVRGQFSMPFKHRVDEGFMACTDCHNPHGAFAPTWRMAGQPHMMGQAKANEEPCLNCHADKRGPFVFEHAAVRVDGCESCHVPHGSTNSRMLKRPVVFTLCLECHNGAGNFGRQANGVLPPAATHNLADPRYQNCTACHVRIHGSNADVTFLR